MNQNNDSIDFFKLIGSIMIFVMHCSAFREIGSGLAFSWELLTRWAVPFFFISSSFFFFSNNKSNILDTRKKYIIRILTLYGAWFIVNLPSIFLLKLNNKDLLSVETWLVFLKGSILSSTFTGSWFLASCIFSCFFVVCFSKILKTQHLLIITFFFQLLCIFSSVWGGIQMPDFLSEALSFLCFPFNIFGGCFYFSIGKLLAEKKGKIKVLDIRICILLFVVSGIMYIAEVLLASKLNLYAISDQSFFVIPFSVFSFITACNSKITLGKKSKIFRKSSTIIFCAQNNFLLIKKYIIAYIGLFFPNFRFPNFVSFLAVSFMMFILTKLILSPLLQNKKFISYLT